MKIYLAGLLFFAIHPALATTHLKDSGQPSELLCTLRGVVTEELGEAAAYQRNGRSQSENRVFWKVAIEEADSASLCPTEKEISLRVRGGDFRVVEGAKLFVYPVHIQAPVLGERIRLRVRLIEGTDALLKRAYREWTLAEVVRD